ncbi:hypothetical protein IU431_12900 [Nocardia otitidiscaviarum]|uniref:LuxR C-terminal-related transcriptional regulator n=1 Tax=Nocardia otitidiscaviarum TaxID=1823 RepID=UPI0011DDB47C|nr:LuxR C-terminal-related transcriptional regulator [Nocardia otitidiscaviarum]MBF6485038.1 hypothetical protein [Nocardia otitidiscaviarum]
MTAAHGLDIPGPDRNSIPAVSGIPHLAFTPIPRGGLLAELQALAEMPEGVAVLMCAPVGSGKTVLLVQWAEAHGRDRVVWLRVDERAPAGQLWQGLRARLGVAAPARDPLSTPLAEAAQLADALARDPRRILLVIDDAHLITDPLTLAGFEHFLLSVPPTVTVVVAARYEPPVRWHPLELSSRLRRWGADRLAFTPDEVARLCRDQGCSLADDELELLMELTRGWAALVRMAAIFLSTRSEPAAAALTALARLPASISDLLAGELIETLSPGLRLFLTHTSVPAEFTEQLADDLVGGGAGHWLHELERLNYPLTSVVRKDREWFAYHPMLRAYFLAELNRLGPQLAEELRLRTSLHLQSIGEPAAALPHVLGLPRWPLLAFLGEHALGLTIAGHGAALFDAVAAADPALSEDPYLLSLRVVDALVHGDIPGAHAHFDACRNRRAGRESFTTADMRTALTAAVTAELAVVAGMSVDDGWAELPPGTGYPDLDCYAAIETGTALLVLGDPVEGEERLRRGLAVAEVNAYPQLRVRALTRLAVSAGLAGALTTMRRRAEHALDVACEHHLLAAPETAQATALVALGAYLQGDALDIDYVTRMLAEHTLVDGSAGANGGWHAHLIGALVSFAAAEDKSAAAELLRTGLVRVLDAHPVPETSAGLVPFVVWALLQVREPYEAQLMVEQARSVLGEVPEVRVARAALAVTAHRSRAVLELVDPLCDAATPVHPVHRVTAWLLYAVAHDELGGTAQSRDGLEHALRHAAAERVFRPFLDVPGALGLLDRFDGSFGHLDAYAATLRRHPLMRRHTAHPGLTGTELKVLRQLPSGRTTQQIADDLGVSINTVKTHLRGIYAKLGSNSRVAVLSEARRSGLL